MSISMSLHINWKQAETELILYFPKLRHIGWDPQLTGFSHDNTPQFALCPGDRVQAKRRILRSKIRSARNWWGWISAGKDETTEGVAPNLCELFQNLTAPVYSEILVNLAENNSWKAETLNRNVSSCLMLRTHSLEFKSHLIRGIKSQVCNWCFRRTTSNSRRDHSQG